MPSVHAKLCSPSGAEQWMACPGSIVMEEGLPDNADQDTYDGTARHIVCADALNEKKDAVDYVGREIVFWSHPESESSGECFREELGDNIECEILRAIPYKDDWADEDQDYLDTVRAMAEGGELYVEQTVNFARFTGVEGDSFGTADAVILKPLADKTYELIVVDRKTGHNEVPVARNKQLMLYALGAYTEHDLVFEISRVRLVIHQRGAREWDCSIEELLAFAEEAKAAAQKVQEAVQTHDAIATEASPTTALMEWQAIYLNPQPTRASCMYCRALAECPAVQAKVEESLGSELGDLDGIEEQPVDVLEPKDIATKYAAVGLIEDWCKAVRERMKALLMNRTPGLGFKLVLGRQGSRKWRNPALAEAYLKETVRMPEALMYDQKLISPTTAEKRAKEKALGPRQWAKLQENIVRAERSISIAPEADPREAYVPQDAADDFQPLPDETGAS